MNGLREGKVRRNRAVRTPAQKARMQERLLAREMKTVEGLKTKLKSLREVYAELRDF